MLDQLVESSGGSHRNNTKIVLLLSTLAIVFFGFIGALGYSLFAQNLGVGGDGLELSTLVAPPIPDEAPPPPEEEKPQEEKTVEKKINADMRKELIASIDTTPTKVPPKPSSEVMNKKTVRPDSPTIKGDRDIDAFDDTKNRPSNDAVKNAKGFNGVGGSGDGGGNNDNDSGGSKPAAPPPIATPPPIAKPTPPPVPKRISKGVINGDAISLPKPAYPPAARAANIKGSVSVQIVISNSGSVISANAVSGHPLLKNAAVAAARRAKFAPTKLSGQAVEVSGVIVYNFQ